MGDIFRFTASRKPLGLRPIARLAPPRRRATHSYLPGLFLLVGVAIIAAAIGSKAFTPPGGTIAEAPGVAHGPLRIIDGDTLHFGAAKIRLVAIDAPERAQTCRDADNRVWPCGQAATARLREIVGGNDVACTPHGLDRYGRTLAVCAAGAVADVGRVLVREGYAVNYPSSSAYAAEENEARAAGRGIWQGAFERPQDWRRRHAPR